MATVPPAGREAAVRRFRSAGVRRSVGAVARTGLVFTTAGWSGRSRRRPGNGLRGRAGNSAPRGADRSFEPVGHQRDSRVGVVFAAGSTPPAVGGRVGVSVGVVAAGWSALVAGGAAGAVVVGCRTRVCSGRLVSGRLLSGCLGSGLVGVFTSVINRFHHDPLLPPPGPSLR